MEDDSLNLGDYYGAWLDDSLEFCVDADHQGGDFRANQVAGTIAQQFITMLNPGLPPGPGSDATDYNARTNLFGPQERMWTTGPPWMESAVEEPVGRAHITYAYEVKMAIWDLVGDTPEASKRHTNVEGQTIGLTFQWDDLDMQRDGTFDEQAANRDQPSTQGPEGGAAWTNASHFSDFILDTGPFVPITGVEATSWGAIKATFRK